MWFAVLAPISRTSAAPVPAPLFHCPSRGPTIAQYDAWQLGGCVNECEGSVVARMVARGKTGYESRR